MKLCWNILNDHHFYLTRNKNLRSTKNGYIYYIKKCKTCNEECLLEKNNYYCTKSCASKDRIFSEGVKEKMSVSAKKRYQKETHPMYGKKHTKESIEKMKISQKGKIISLETKIKISKSLKDRYKKEIHLNCNKINDLSHNWKGGVTKKKIPFYDTYASQLDWCEEIRRSLTDENILEVKCVYCGKWFIPSISSISNRLQFIKGNNKYSENRLYCSDGCKKACPTFGKTAETLMKEDAIRAGRLSWLELNREVQPELRQIVFKRDSYKCVKCNSDVELHCHHVYPVATDPLLSADVDNCIILCVECHKEVHKMPGCKYNELKECM